MIKTLRKGWIGVDLGTHAVKLAQVERVSGEVRLREALIIKRTMPSQGRLIDADSFVSVDELSAGLSLGRHFSGRRAACSPSMRLCQLRMLDIPHGNERERRAAIARELDSLEPGLLSQSEFDYWDAQRPAHTATSAGQSVGVMTITSRCAWRIAGDVSQVGLWCTALDGIPLALARAAWMARSHTEPPMAALLDLGANSTTFCVAYEGQPLYVRSLLRCGQSRIVDALAPSLGISPEEVQLVLRTHGVPSPRGGSGAAIALQEVVAQAACGPLAALVDELNRTLEYLRTHRSELAPNHILLFGGGATIRNLPELLAHKTGITARVWRPAHESSAAANGTCPWEMLGPAIALSSLAWSA
jgi:Tfp pilus assembly PilM family ATPase